MAKRLVVFLYGLGCYMVFFLTFVYAVGFIGNLYIPRSLDSAKGGPSPMLAQARRTPSSVTENLKFWRGRGVMNCPPLAIEAAEDMTF